jgi:hypothetical protein
MRIFFHAAFLFCITLSTVYAEGILQHYHMPPLHRVAPDDTQAQAILKQARVLKRAESVAVKFAEIEDPQTATERLRTEIHKHLPQWPERQSSFAGDNGAALAEFLAAQSETPVSVSLQAAEINLDASITVPSGVFIDGRNTLIRASGDVPAFNMHSQSGLKNMRIHAPGLAVKIHDQTQILLHNLTVSGGRAVAVIGKNHGIDIHNVVMDKATQGGILIQGETRLVWLRNNRITDAQRADNGGSAIIVTDAEFKDDVEAMSSGAALAEHIWPLVPTPYALLIEENYLSDNRAQGLYIDGGYGIVARRNIVENNDKEGMCLDFGAVNNIVMENTIRANGNRARQTDEDLKHDLVLNFGRMSDGSAISKLPGISFDNAAQNIVMWNIVRDNAGDGIKMVRTGMRNFILFNSITDNNQGHNSRFHFFGILLGTALLEEELSHLDLAKHPIDFLPSTENVIAGNVLYGKHYAAILLDRQTSYNDIYDNTAHHFRQAPLESASDRHNSMVGNSWNR